MTAHTHPAVETISSYALGGLPLGPSLAVSLHLEACPACRAAVRDLEEDEGRRMLSLPVAPLSPGALQRVLARIAAEAPALASTPEKATLPGDIRLPPTLAKVGLSAPLHLTPDAWVAHLDAPRDGGWRTYLFCAPAETALPRHGHLGDEMIVVLEGGFNDGREFAKGDFAENRTGFIHEMQVSANGRLVALISSGGAIDWLPADRGIGTLLDI